MIVRRIAREELDLKYDIINRGGVPPRS